MVTLKLRQTLLVSPLTFFIIANTKTLGSTIHPALASKRDKPWCDFCPFGSQQKYFFSFFLHDCQVLENDS